MTPLELRRQQLRDQICRKKSVFIVYRGHDPQGYFTTREQAEQPAEFRELAVRNCDAVANRGGAELLTLQQDFQNRTFALTREFGRARGELLDRLLLAVDLERRNNCRRRDEIGERHGSVQ